jgi:Zn-dependent protease
MKLKIHPLFLVFGIILTVLGNGYLFLVYIFTAVVHEFAHALAAMFFKCRSDEIVLYPYGAVLYGEFSVLKPYQEAVVALAGLC